MIKDIIIMESELAIKWNDSLESYLSFKVLRDNCPCAFCSGETDVLGNVYKGARKNLGKLAYEIKNIDRVGHYAIRIVWGDRHADGLYTFDMLRKFTNNIES